MRKLISLTALLLCISLLCACGTKTPEETISTSAATSGSTADTAATTTSSATTEATEKQEPTLSDLIADFKTYEMNTFPTIYTQEDVCPEPALSSYKKFSACATAQFIVPGLNQSIVPQGMDYWEEMGWMLISGYCSDESKNGGKGSALFAVDVESGKMVAEYYLKNMDGSYHTSHAGGVAVTKKNVFIANGGVLFRIPLTDLLKQCGDVTIVEEIKVPVRASLANCSGGILWVGDFQYGTSYPTQDFQKMRNRQGAWYYAWTVGYVLDETTENELKPTVMAEVDGQSYAIPDYILSTTERIQGMAYLPEVGQIVLSQSYGRTNSSTLFFYEDPLGQEPHTQFEWGGFKIPVWFLDNKLSTKEMPAIPMSEGIANVNGKLYVLFESGADKYRLGGGKQPTDMVYAVDITKW
jgi:hypothetical protein